MVVGAALFALASLLAASVAQSVGGKPLTLLVRLVFDLLLAYLIVKGVSWARWLVVVLGAVGAIILGATVVKGAGSVPAFNLLLGIGMTSLYVAVIVILGFSPSARRYFRPLATESSVVPPPEQS